jgi:CheY-like chemotaxis protein
MNHKGCPWVLIVDDEENVRDLLRITFEKLIPDYRVVTASDSYVALGRMMQYSFDLVLTDWHMAGMDGVELAVTIRNISPDTRILLMTGSDPDELHSLVESLGLNGWLEKPFTLAQVLHAVEQAMDYAGGLASR